jgi:hypothetical protein
VPYAQTAWGVSDILFTGNAKGTSIEPFFWVNEGTGALSGTISTYFPGPVIGV